MKINKILAGAAAAALAVSSIAATAFADAAHSGSYSFSDSTWWTQDWVMGGDSGKPVSDLIGDVDPSTVTSITFTSDTVFVIGYNNTEGGWSQPSDQTSYTLTDVLLESYTDDAGETHDPALCLCLSKGDGVEYTINWTVEADASASADNSSDDSAVYDVDVQLAVMDNVTWATQTSDKVNISKNGEYTFKLDGLDIAPASLCVIYIKDAVAIEEGDNLAADYKSNFDGTLSYALKINGIEVPISDEMPATLEDLDNSAVVDFCFFNVWGKDYIALPEVDAINSVELVVNVASKGGASAPAQSQPEESKPEESKPEESKPEESKAEESKPEESKADENNQPAETQAPAGTEAAGNVGAATDDKGSPDTGIAGVAAVAGVAVVAALGVVIAKKRK